MECVPMGAIIIKRYHYTELYATLLWAKFHLLNTNFFGNNLGKIVLGKWIGYDIIFHLQFLLIWEVGNYLFQV